MVHCHCKAAPICLLSSVPALSSNSWQSNTRVSWFGKQFNEAQHAFLEKAQPAFTLRSPQCRTWLHQRRQVVVAAHHKGNDADLTVSLYWPYKNLPPEGKTRTENEESCNPEERSCQTPMHVYERACKTCQGTGSISSSTRGRRRTSSYVCLRCQGLGFVRHTSSRFMPPGLNNGSGDYTIGRPVPPPPEEDDKKRKYRSLRR